MKDYHDLLIMSRENKLLDLVKLKNTISSTFSHRGTDFTFPLKMDDLGAQSLQRLWTNHLRGLGQYKNKLNFPDKIEILNKEVAEWLFAHNIINILMR